MWLRRCEAGPNYRAKVDKATGKVVPPEEPEATWERTFSQLTPLSSLDRAHLAEVKQVLGTSALAGRDKEEDGLCPDYASLSKWLDDKKNAGTIRLLYLTHSATRR